MTPAERWGADLRSLLRIFNASTAVQLPDTWRMVAPLNKDRARAAMKTAYRRTSKSLRFCPRPIPHTVAVMVMALDFHTKDPYEVGDALNIFLFTDLSPSAGSEAALLMRKWDAILGSGTLNFFADTSMLMENHKVAPIAGWDESAS